MKAGTIAIVLTGLLTAGALQSSGQAAPSGTATRYPDARLAAGGEGTYSRTCAYCHGANVGPVLLGRGLDPAAIAAMVRNGMGAMPAFRPTEISDAELADLAAWVSKSAPAQTDHGK